MPRKKLGEIDSNATYDISISASPAAGGTVTGAGEYHAGKVAITAAANPGYRFVEWRENDAQISTDSTYILTADSNHNIVAVFEEETAAPTTYTVTIDSTIENGTVTANQTTGLKAGDEVTLTYDPDDGYCPIALRIGDSEVSYNNLTGEPITFSMPDHDVIVSATFGPIKLLLKVTDEGNEITSPATATVDGIVINNTSPTEFLKAPGEYTGIVDNPPDGYKQSSPFKLFIDEYNFLYSWEVTTSHEADGVFIVSVILEKEPDLTVTIDSGIENGTVTANQTTGLKEGDEVTLTVTPADGYELDGYVTVTGESGTPCEFDSNSNSFLMPAENVNVTATFSPIPTYAVTVSANPADGGTASGGGTYERGELITVIATANEGYAFVNWTENGTEVSANAEYSFNVTGDRNLVANFEKLPPSEFTVTYKVGDTVVYTDKYEAGETIVHPDRDGFKNIPENYYGVRVPGGCTCRHACRGYGY